MKKTVALLKHKRSVLLTVEVDPSQSPFDAIFGEISKKINESLAQFGGATLEDAIQVHHKEVEEVQKNPKNRGYGYRYYETDTRLVERHINLGRWRQNFKISGDSFEWVSGNVVASYQEETRKKKNVEEVVKRWVVMAGTPGNDTKLECSRTQVGAVFCITSKTKMRGSNEIVEFTIKEYCVSSSLEGERWGRSFVFDGKKSPDQHIPISIAIRDKNDRHYDSGLKFDWDLSISSEEARLGTIFELIDTACLLSRRMRQIIYASNTVGRTCKAALKETTWYPVRVKI